MPVNRMNSSTDMTALAQRYASAGQTSSPEEGSPVQEIVSSAVQEADQKSKSLSEMMREAKEKAEETKKKFQLPKSGARYGDAPIMAYARLSKARNTAEVNAAAGYARRSIAQLKTALRQDSEHAEQIKAAINQLQKAVTRAGKKRRDLETERLVEVRRAHSQEENRRAEAQRLQQDLRRRKVLRVIRESGYIREANVDNQLQAQMAATRLQLQSQAHAISNTVSPQAAAQQYTAMSAGASADISPEVSADISVDMPAAQDINIMA